MSHGIFTSELFVTLSDEQQQLLTGGVDFELAGSNFSQRRANLLGKFTGISQFWSRW